MAELPLGKGTWPAIWFLGNNYKTGTTWPKSVAKLIFNGTCWT